jgi:polyphosphate kinase
MTDLTTELGDLALAADVVPALEARLANRELSWLDFNERVLALAEDPAVPLLERTKFVAIFASNLDEFYQVRVASLRKQEVAAPTLLSPDGLDATTQLRLIGERVAALSLRHARFFTHELKPRLARAGIRVLRWRHLSADEQAELSGRFVDEVLPVLTPLAVDPSHPFPFISNLSLNLAVWLRDPAEREMRFARVKVPAILPRFMGLSAGAGLVPLEDVIAANLEQLFPGMEIVSRYPFRVTRASDLDFDDDDAEDLLRAIEAELQRYRTNPVVRLEVARRMPGHLVHLLTRELRLDPLHVHRLGGVLALADLSSIAALPRSDLSYPSFVPTLPPELVRDADGRVDMFATLDEADVLVHHPYDSFQGTVQALIEQAAADPDVLAIKQTLYRTSGGSPIVDALVAAARAGKQVVVLIEIKARFDEIANIAWARTLEEAGCHVVYGLIGLKTHCKLLLVVRRERDGLRRYVHIGTGNYHPTTARLYEDVGLLTADPDITAAVSGLFNLLTGYGRQASHEALMVAPFDVRSRLLDLIGAQAERAAAGEPARITMKMNSLVDSEMVEALYAASGAGVRVDLVVRGICALRPGVPGMSENIRVVSVVGRFLEHSRIYRFGPDGTDETWIGSADLMPRNLDRRVEALVRLDDATHRARVGDILQRATSDGRAWELDANGTWARRGGDAPTLQEELVARAQAAVSTT